jgi:hypothetical protein
MYRRRALLSAVSNASNAALAFAPAAKSNRRCSPSISTEAAGRPSNMEPAEPMEAMAAEVPAN